MVISITAANLNVLNAINPPQSVVYTKDATPNVTKVCAWWRDFGPIVFDFGTGTKPSEAAFLAASPGAIAVEAIVTP